MSLSILQARGAEKEKKFNYTHVQRFFKGTFSARMLNTHGTNKNGISTGGAGGKDRSQALEQSKQHFKTRDINFSQQFSAMY